MMSRRGFCRWFLGLSLLIIATDIPSNEAAPQGSLISQLPGFSGTFPSQHYGGYVSFNEKNLYYYFISSERNPLEDPVVLWLNGGPGCSSFDGFVYEHGPFNYKNESSKGRSLLTLHLNPYSWSKVSNMIYLDSPCGVGLSYSKNQSNYVTDDFQTAIDSHTFLLKWFELYPEFAKNPFYISGESYAGVYVPMLSTEVVKGIKAGVQPVINFKVEDLFPPWGVCHIRQGYLVGNGVIDDIYEGTEALLQFAHGMGLISNDIYEEAEANCKFVTKDSEEACFKSMGKVDECISGLNPYDTLEPCYHDPEAQAQAHENVTLPLSFQQLGKTERPLKVRKRMFGRAWPLGPITHFNGSRNLPSWPTLLHQMTLHGFVPCTNDKIATGWLNESLVRQAIHAEPISVTGPWELCTGKIDYGFGAGSMMPYHRNLTMQGYPALIYSGDHDMCVPFTGTEAWTRGMGYNITDEWRPWFSNDQVAGYLQGYDHNLTFLTIKGAGHTVPEYKPRESLDFYSRWLAGKPI